MEFFNRVVDVAKDIVSEVPKDFRAIQNTGQMIMPGGQRAMSAVRQLTKGKLGGDDLHKRSVADQLGDVGRAGIAVGSLLPVGAGLKAGKASIRYGGKVVHATQNLRTGKSMYKGAKQSLKAAKLMPKTDASRAAKIATAKANKKRLARLNIQYGPGMVKYVASNTGKALTAGVRSSATLVPAATPRSNEGYSKRKRLAKSTAKTIKGAVRVGQKLGGILI